MNVTELARQLRVDTKLLLELLPQYGFDIGMKAIKIDNRVAQQVMRTWPRIRRDIDRKKREEQEERKRLEREARKQGGESVHVPHVIRVRDFAERVKLPVTQIITELMKNGILANQNQDIDFDTASIIGEELGFIIKHEDGEKDLVEDDTHLAAISDAHKRATQNEPRAPVVVVMGHVDHGKTKLLDTIRRAHVIDKESGGITQHIGAYQTMWKDPKSGAERALTFIDTPGHEAFTVMRSRGAKIADIGILVVAADDGVKPQTEEVIQILRAAKLPFVVAINKIDKENADVQRVRSELSERNIISEEWGGDVPMIEISAKSEINIDKLLDVLLLVTDMNQDKIQADPTLPAVGTIIDSHVDKGKGPVATVLVQVGTLHQGDELVVNGEIYGRVRAMYDYKGDEVKAAGPSVPVQIIGFKVAPEVGDILDVSQAATAQKIDIKQKRTQQTGAERQTVGKIESTEEEQTKKKTLNVVVKADVLGSLEAIIGSLQKIKHDEVGVKIIGKGLGNITEDDVNKAEAGSGVLLGFHVKPTPGAEEHIRDKDMTFLRYEVIYDLLDWVKEELGKMLSIEKITTEVGTFEVRALFRRDKQSSIIGGVVKHGKAKPDTKARVKRGSDEVGVLKVVGVQIGQQKTKEVTEGIECGVALEGKVRIEIGDMLEFFTEVDKAREIRFEK